MKNVLSVLLFIGFMFAVNGCQHYDEGTRTVDSAAYLSFEGEMIGLDIYLDGSRIPDIEAGAKNRLLISPGTHSIRIVRQQEIILERELFFSNGQIRTIRIPN